MNNQDHIEWLKEEIGRGEGSLDTASKVYGCIHETNPRLYKRFSVAYDRFLNDEDELPEGLIEEVVAAMSAAPEYIPYDTNADTKGIMDFLP